MPRRVLDVGNCVPDHAAIRRLIEENFQAEVVRATAADAAVRRLRDEPFHLVLVNRILDADGDDGQSLIERIRADARLLRVPVMMVTNYPDCQERAVRAGAEPGFGKAALGEGRTLERLRKVLG